MSNKSCKIVPSKKGMYIVQAEPIKVEKCSDKEITPKDFFSRIGHPRNRKVAIKAQK